MKTRVRQQTAVCQTNHLPEPVVVHNHGMASKA
ncbi:hypothetical protein [Scytonema sp. HK-05]